MTTITIPGKQPRRAPDRFAAPVIPNYREDIPCLPGKHALWPGGPALPLWAEREMRAKEAAEKPLIRVVASGRLKKASRSKQ